MLGLRNLVLGLVAIAGSTVAQGALVPANADIITLVCYERGITSVGLYLRIDTAASTVTNWNDPNTPAASMALPATMTPDQITWMHYDVQNVLDRNSGELTRTGMSQLICKRSEGF